MSKQRRLEPEYVPWPHRKPAPDTYLNLLPWPTELSWLPDPEQDYYIHPDLWYEMDLLSPEVLDLEEEEEELEPLPEEDEFMSHDMIPVVTETM